jgi:large subunit ribosomal protein L13Ae
VPDALRVLRLKAHRRFTVIGKLATEVGWKHGELVARLEAKRKVKSEAYYKKKLAQTKRINEATAKVFSENANLKPTLAAYGHA